MRPTAPVPALGLSAGGPVLPDGLVTAVLQEKEYTALETSKIQAACSLTGEEWLTDLPKLYPCMLEEGRTTAQVKALLENIFQPDDIFSLFCSPNPCHCGCGQRHKGIEFWL